MASSAPAKAELESSSSHTEFDTEGGNDDSLVEELDTSTDKKWFYASLYTLVFLTLTGILCFFFLGSSKSNDLSSNNLNSNDDIAFLPSIAVNTTDDEYFANIDYPLLDSRSSLFNFDYEVNTFLKRGQAVEQGNPIYIRSGNMGYYLQQQSDGNLVFRNEKQRVFWNSGVVRPKVQAPSSKRYWTSLQSDGNLVTYSRVNNDSITVEWASDTTGIKPANYSLVLTPSRDGLMVARPDDDQIVWTTAGRSQNPSMREMETVFYAIGDVPYHGLEKTQLKDRMRELPLDGEFLIHVGDIRSAEDNQRCRIEDYQEVHNILRQSKIPVFIIPGDNEWNDCRNPSDAKRFWRDTFHEFDMNWNHTFNVQRHPAEPENFFFVYKRTLYFGLNVLGGRFDLREKFDFVKENIDKHVVAGDAVNVVIFGHAFPVGHHEPFFDPLRDYIRASLKNKVPILYLNGDYHFYESEKDYLGFSNFNRLQVAQGTAQPPLKVSVGASSSRSSWNANEAFSHDRMLWLSL